ncbi:MarR family transcriptional regulator, 2-MHQ and catechol-resistance regulon repressor [Gammaproteobacteria bacterium]
MSQERFLPVIRALAKCYQAFESHSSKHIRMLGLTSPQFDIIATLGNTSGMTCGELGELTLITKGTLTGVLDRLEAKQLLIREHSQEDGRSWKVCLTPEGQKLFEQIFPDHLNYLRPLFKDFTDTDMELICQQLSRLEAAFTPDTATSSKASKESR